MDWFCVDSDMPRHPKVLALAHRLHISRAEAVGYWTTFLACVAEHAEDGSLLELDDDVIEEWAGWSKDRGYFVKAAIEVRLIDGGKRAVHGWKKRHEYMLRERKRKAVYEKQRRSAARQPRAARAPTARLPNPTEPNRTEPNPTSVTERPVVPDVPSAAREPSPVSASSTNLADSARLGSEGHFPTGFFETPGHAEACEQRIKTTLFCGEGDVARFWPGVVAEVVRSSRPKRNPRAYATKLSANKKWLREVAARLESEEADEREARAHGPPERRGGAQIIGELVRGLVPEKEPSMTDAGRPA